MPTPAGWNASTAVVNCAVIPWQGRVWRGHARRFAPTDWQGSLLFSGRFNRGQDRLLPATQVWPVLYLALNRDAVLGEIMRHFVSNIPSQLAAALVANPSLTAPEIVEHVRSLLSGLNDRVISELSIELSHVLDCRDVNALGLAPPRVQPADLYHDTDYTIGQELAAAVIDRGCEAMLIPSATGFGDSLIIFPRSLQPASLIRVVDTVDSPFFVDRR